MHLNERLRVVRQVAVHAVEQTEFVGVFRQFREHFGDVESALAAFVELERRAEEFAAAETPGARRADLPSSAVSFGL